MNIPESKISPESTPRSPDRILMLEPMEGKKPLDSIGLVDPRLFKSGEDANRLHAVMDTNTCLWTFKYEKGAIPEALRGQFTGFKKLKEFAEAYFTRRNVKITEVKD